MMMMIERLSPCIGKCKFEVFLHRSGRPMRQARRPRYFSLRLRVFSVKFFPRQPGLTATNMIAPK